MPPIMRPSRIRPAAARVSPLLPVQGYPEHLVEQLTLRDGSRVTIRPIRPEDAEIEREFVRRLSDESRYFRFMDALRELDPRMVRHFTEIDYRAHLALVALGEAGGGALLLAVARYITGPDSQRAEFAIVVADDWQRRGLGEHLMRRLVAAARANGIAALHGEVLPGNHKMLRLMEKLGFSAKFDEENPRVLRFETGL
jgi:acetyltransferase